MTRSSLRPAWRGPVLGAALGVALGVGATPFAANVRAQTLQSFPPGLAASAIAIERAAIASFAGPDRIGKDGPLAPIGLDLARIYAAAADSAFMVL